MKKVLITGGSGLVGSKLAMQLKEKGYKVCILSRNASLKSDYKVYDWNPNKDYINPEALKDVDYIVHLAGENLGAGRWTKKRKQKIIDSRVKTSELLFRKLSEIQHKPKAFVSASAVGIYPSFREGEEYYIENDMYGTSFAAKVCIEWEKAADNFKRAGIRTVKIRTGLVQDKKDPALKKILQLAAFGILPVFAKGKHYYPWIHIDDLVNLYVTAIENDDFEDPFNAVAPDFVTNIEYIKTIKKIKAKGVIVKIPAFLLRLMFGEMSEIVMRGTKVHSKIHNNVFEFKYPKLSDAMNDLLK